jgi:hypothetical protein
MSAWGQSHRIKQVARHVRKLPDRVDPAGGRDLIERPTFSCEALTVWTARARLSKMRAAHRLRRDK